MSRMFILYDGRACGGRGTDDASVLVACDTEEEAKGYFGKYGDMACYSYAKSYKKSKRLLIGERWEWDYIQAFRPHPACDAKEGMGEK